MDMYLACATDCEACCRYLEFLPDEALAFAVPLGLRVSLLPKPTGIWHWKKRKDLATVLPQVSDYYMDIRFVDAGYYSLFHGVCRYRTRRKERCLLGAEAPLLCQVRPLEPMFPASMQVDVIHFAKTTLSCLGFQETGVKLCSVSPFSVSLCNDRGEHWQLAREKRKLEKTLYQQIADIVCDRYEEEWDSLVAEMSRNIFRLMPATVLFQALFEMGRITNKIATDLVGRQIEAVEKDIRLFLEEYGQKTCFPKITRKDGETIHLRRGQYLQRMRMWLSEYRKTINALHA